MERLRKTEIYFIKVPKKIFVTTVTELPEVLTNKKPISTAIKYLKLSRDNLNNNSAETELTDVLYLNNADPIFLFNYINTTSPISAVPD